MYQISPFIINNELIYLYKDSQFSWFIDEFTLSRLFKVDISKIVEFRRVVDIQKDDRGYCKLEKSLSKEELNIYLWSRKGVIRFAYSLKSIDIFDIVDELEEIKFPREEPIYQDINSIFQERVEKLKESGSLKEIDEFLSVFNRFTKEKLGFEKREEDSFKSIFMKIFEDILSQATPKS
jgi:hypothetical protein